MTEQNEIDFFLSWLKRRAHVAATLQDAIHARPGPLDHTLKTDWFATALSHAQDQMEAVDGELGWPAERRDSYSRIATAVARVARGRRIGVPEKLLATLLADIPKEPADVVAALTARA